MKFYLGLKSTMLAVQAGVIKLEDVAAGHLMVGPIRDIVLHDGVAPSELLSLNRELPRYLPDVDLAIGEASLDGGVTRLWSQFRTAMRDMESTGRVTYADDRNYPAKALSLLQKNQENEVFFDGEWCTAARLKYLEQQ